MTFVMREPVIQENMVSNWCDDVAKMVKDARAVARVCLFVCLPTDKECGQVKASPTQ